MYCQYPLSMGTSRLKRETLKRGLHIGIVTLISGLGYNSGIGSGADYFLSEPQFLCLSNEAIGRDVSMVPSHET